MSKLTLILSEPTEKQEMQYSARLVAAAHIELFKQYKNSGEFTREEALETLKAWVSKPDVLSDLEID